jgi:LytS/YehU family sensor histidine kinase
MCILLADFLRSSLALGSLTTISLREELALAKKYLAVEQVRFAGRMSLRENVGEDSLDCTLPALLLQPLVENAVKHGIATLSEGGSIELRAGSRGSRLEISIENNFDPEAPPRSKSGLGLQNVRNRLHARYGEEASVETRSDGDRFRVELRLPAERSSHAGATA